MSKGIKVTLWTKFDRRRREEEEGEEDRRKTISLHLKGFQINDFKLYKPTSSCCTVRSGINMSRFICSTVLPKRIDKWRIIDFFNQDFEREQKQVHVPGNTHKELIC